MSRGQHAQCYLNRVEAGLHGPKDINVNTFGVQLAAASIPNRERKASPASQTANTSACHPAIVWASGPEAANGHGPLLDIGAAMRRSFS